MVLRQAVVLLVAGMLIAGCNQTTVEPGQKPNPQPGEPSAPLVVTYRLSAEGLPVDGNWKCDPAVGDVNRDGFMDLAAVPRLGHGAHVWLGNGKGQWQESSTGLGFGQNSCGGGVAMADVNNDGLVDLVVADHCQGLFVFLGDGAGQWTMVARAIYPSNVPQEEDSKVEQFTGTEDLSVGDVNEDGKLDIIASASDSGGISLFFGDGSGENWTYNGADLPYTGWAPRLMLVDINKDGHLDLVASRDEGPRVWLGDGTGRWRSTSRGFPSPAWKGLYGGLDVGDINEDGLLDVAVSNWIDGPEVYLQRADGNWEKTPDVFPKLLGGSFGLSLGDIDRDGHLDMAVSGRLTTDVGYVYGVFVLRGDGRGGWTHLSNTGLPQTALAFTWGVTLADVNGDGVLDLVAGSGGTVASDRTRTEPAFKPRLLVWLAELAKKP